MRLRSLSEREPAALLKLGLSIAGLVVRLTPAGNLVDVIDQGARVVRQLGPLASDAQGASRLAHSVRDSMARSLAIEFPVADEGNVTSATLAVQRLLDSLGPTTLMVAAVSDRKALETQLLADGGAKARASLGSAEAEQLFDAILRESVATIASLAPHDGRFIATALPNVLQRQKQMETRVDGHDHDLDDLRAIVLRAGSASEEPTEPLVRGYLNEIQALAPAALEGRDSEIAEMAQFVRDDGQFWWWRAEPWTGKTALMATLALATLPGIKAVSFFVLGREDTANTRARFYAHVMPQLALLAGNPTLRISSDAAQARDQFNDLLWRAAEACSREGDRLLLLVDGLDEDAFLLGPNSPQGSIAGALPSRLPARVTVLVASRTNPQLPDDVPAHHPLRDRGCWHDLAASPAARAARQAAEADLRDLVTTPLGMGIASTIAAARAPLTSADLSDVIGVDYLAVLGLMDSRPARALVPVQSAMGVGYPPAYRLGHAKLDESLVAVLDPRAPARADADPHRWEAARASALAPWRERIYTWGQGWAALGWPAETPGYLLGDAYLALLDQDGRADQLIDVLTDIHRANRLYQDHQADFAAPRQIRAAATQFTDQRDPDLGRLGRLMVTYERLAARNDRTPLPLLELLVFTDRTARAAGIARGISDPEPRVRALLAVANSCLTAGHRGDARAAGLLADESLEEIPEHQASSLAEDVARLRATADRDLPLNTSERDLKPFSLPLPSETIAVPDYATVDPEVGAAAKLLAGGDAAGARGILSGVLGRMRISSSRVGNLHALVQISGEVGLHDDPIAAWADLTRTVGTAQAWPLGVALVRGLTKGGHQAAAEGLARHLLQAAKHVDNEARRVHGLAAAATAMLVVGDRLSAAGN